MEKYETFVLQHPRELEEFLVLLRVEGVKSYLEIGSKFGGLLWKVGNALPAGSRVVSIDLPWGDGSFKQSQPWLEKCVAALQGKGYDARLLIGDSHDPASVAFAESLAPFDCVMIDGDHTAAGVRADWGNYGRLGRMVCFHDINWQPRPSKKAAIEVPAFWDQLKANYRHVEVRHDAIDNGIGILWRD
jgi:predicted O-methyltransferase YrrM